MLSTGSDIRSSNLSADRESNPTISASGPTTPSIMIAARPIAIVTPGSFPIPSGRSSSVELVSMNVGQQLRHTHGMPLKVYGVKAKKYPARQWIHGVLYIRFPRKGYIRHICASIKKQKPAIIQVENRPRYAHFLKKRLGQHVPVVLSLHSLTFVSRPHITRTKLLPCLRSVDAILVNSFYLMGELLKLDSALVDKIKVNHLGVNAETFTSRWSANHQSARLTFLNSFGWKDCKIILFVGRLIPIKGVHHLLQAMPKVLEHEPNAKLLIVGGAFYGSNKKTAYVAKLQRLAEPIAHAVRFISYVPHGKIAEWFRLADTLVVPSAEQEAFGLVNVEAMASGVPVIATRAGGMKEVIEHGRTGLLVPHLELEHGLPHYILTLLKDESYARSLGEQGRQTVLERFTWQHTAARLACIYESLLEMK